MSLTQLSSFRDFTDDNNSLITEDEALNMISEDISSTSILKGGSDASDAIKDIYEMASREPQYTITAHDQTKWYYTRQRNYSLEIEKNLNLIILRGQKIRITNITAMSVYVKFMTLDNSNWYMDSVLEIKPFMSILR